MRELIEVDLAEDERSMIRWGLLDWGGPANPSEGLARAMGFESVADLLDSNRALAHAVSACEGLSRRDWTRALIATEIVWVSTVFGSGNDSQYTSGYSDTDAITILRSLQAKLGRAGALVSGRMLT